MRLLLNFSGSFGIKICAFVFEIEFAFGYFVGARLPVGFLPHSCEFYIDLVLDIVHLKRSYWSWDNWSILRAAKHLDKSNIHTFLGQLKLLRECCLSMSDLVIYLPWVPESLSNCLRLYLKREACLRVIGQIQGFILRLVNVRISVIGLKSLVVSC